MRRLLFRPEVEEDLAEGSEWFEGRRVGLGAEFEKAVEETLEAIANNPLRFPPIHGKVRCARLKRFQYGVFYYVFREPVVVVLSVLHLSRDPELWKKRL